MVLIALLFFKERITFLDTAYHLYCILRDKGFELQNYRFCAAFTQSFPLIGAFIGLPLNYVAMLYSASFVLLQALSFLIISLLIKNHRVALIQLLYSVMMTSHIFYWIMPELNQGISFLLLWLAIVDNRLNHQNQKQADNHNPLRLFFQLVLIVTIAFAHPLMLFAYGFVILFLFLHYPKQWKIISIHLLFFVITYLIKLFFFRNQYDEGGREQLFRHIELLYPNFLNQPALKLFLQYLITDYYMLPIMLTICVLNYSWRKHYRKLTALLLSFICLFILIQITFFYGADQFYIENQYLLLGLFVIIAFAYDIYGLNESLNPLKRATVNCLVVIVVITGILRIYLRHEFYTNRLNWYKHYIQKLPEAKMMIPLSEFPADTMKMTWGVPYETWLISTLIQGKTIAVVPYEAETQFDWIENTANQFITPWGSTLIKDLDTNYFRLDTLTPYVKVTGKDILNN